MNLLKKILMIGSREDLNPTKRIVGQTVSAFLYFEKCACVVAPSFEHVPFQGHIHALAHKQVSKTNFSSFFFFINLQLHSFSSIVLICLTQRFCDCDRFLALLKITFCNVYVLLIKVIFLNDCCSLKLKW